jgi:predicted GNAT family acetyltransferase
MRWLLNEDLPDFATAVLPWLERDPVAYNVHWTVVSALVKGDLPVEPGSFWARLVDGDEPHAVALRTPPHPLLLTQLASATARSLAAALEDRELSGVTGPPHAARLVRDALARPFEPGMMQRTYRLDAVTPPVRPAPGRLVAASPADEALVVAWSEAFAAEAGTPGGNAIRQAARRRIDNGQLWLWELDGVPVSMACGNHPAAGVVRVGLVYTPPGQRRRGYASACVAAVSQRVLDDGASTCMLYTDLANPTSNAIYQAIGYRPVGDIETWEFRAT